MPKSIRFSARIRYWKKQSGLAVVDVPANFVEALRATARCVSGTLNAKPFTGATMLVLDGGFGVAVSILPNFAHHVTQCPLDGAFSTHAWEATNAAAPLAPTP